jgi:uncharacterized membrane protein YhaH (DUF805 family)
MVDTPSSHSQGLRDVTLAAPTLVATPDDISSDIFPPVFKIFSFRGRIGRLGFFFYNLAVIAAFLIAIAIGLGALEVGLIQTLTIATPLVQQFGNQSVTDVLNVVEVNTGLQIALAGCAFLVMLVCNFSIGTRRCHDLDHSGGVLIGATLVGVVPYIGSLISGIFGLYLTFASGTPGDNQYGPPPEYHGSLANFKQLPNRLWRGELGLANTFWIYIFFFDFLIMDKAVSAAISGYLLENLSLAYVGFLLLANGCLSVALWRSAQLYEGLSAWRFLGKGVALFMVGRLLLTIYALALSGR